MQQKNKNSKMSLRINFKKCVNSYFQIMKKLHFFRFFVQFLDDFKENIQKLICTSMFLENFSPKYPINSYVHKLYFEKISNNEKWLSPKLQKDSKFRIFFCMKFLHLMFVRNFGRTEFSDYHQQQHTLYTYPANNITNH